ncbi:LANO_0E08438g1_1 [Lachancea nothofagi CBS 11611]|uniref:LANO_0E08438g1_1 n=1 Tax=Lachancea nothofagi CBS 11611 TaxID=1266666 RepID=A0A1G4JVI9_9SACH|nr:LANO_0E08438g1_1 [Lachancea nothofagi CBS 11611]
MILNGISRARLSIPRGSLNFTRSVSRSTPLWQQMSGNDSTGSKKNSKPTDFNPRHLGISADVYIPPSFKNLPSAFSHPIVFSNAVIRRIYTFGLNTVQVALFRYQSGLKPNFLLWKNRAIETYVGVNKAFAARQLDSVKPQMSLWVDEALTARAKQLPKNVELDWQLLKFHKVPKLVSVQVMMIPGRPLEHIQLIYKFETKQRLIKLNKNTHETNKLDRDVTDYVAFLCDASTNELILIGSVFESEPTAKLPKNYEDNMQTAIQRMKTSGDLYRINSK